MPEYSAQASVLLVLALENLHSHVVDGGVVKNHDSTVRSRLDVDSTILAKLVVCAAEVVADSLGGYVQAICYLTDRTVGEAVLDTAEVVEGDGLGHDY